MKNNDQKPFKNMYDRDFTALESTILLSLSMISLFFYFVLKAL